VIRLHRVAISCAAFRGPWTLERTGSRIVFMSFAAFAYDFLRWE